MSSSRVFRSRSVPSATPMRVSSPISRLRFAASARARAVSARAAASRYPARTATRSCRGPTGCRTKPESSSEGISAGRSGSPSRPSATIAPPASMNARSTSSGKAERLSESSTNTVGRSSTTRSRGVRTSRDSIWALSRAGRTAAGAQEDVWSSRYLTSRVLDALEPLPRLRVLREDGQCPLVHLHGLVLLAAVLVQQRFGVERQRLGRDLPAGPRIRGLPREPWQIGVLHQTGAHRPDDLARLDVDEARVEAKVSIEVDEAAGDDVARPHELADLGRCLRRHLARGAEVLLRQELLDLLTLDHPGRGIGSELRDQHPRDSLLEGVEILLVLPVRAAVVERQDGEPRPAVLTVALRGQPRPSPRARDATEQGERHNGADRTRVHSGSPRQRVSVMPSCAATTSAGRPLGRAWRRAAATSASIASSPCSGS